MDHTPAGQREANPGPAEYFTGTVLLERLIAPQSPARSGMLRVQFNPGARTFWHTHDLGQALYVLNGFGLIALRGEAPRHLNPGDTVWIPPGVEHWHGAAPSHTMTHIAMQEIPEGGAAATWLEEVSEADYSLSPAKG